MNLRIKDIIGGILILLIAGALYFVNWYLIVNESRYYPKAMFIGATMMIVGLGLIIFGGYRTERINRGEDISSLSGLSLFTPRWWVIFVIAIAFGAANWIYVVQFYNP